MNDHYTPPLLSPEKQEKAYIHRTVNFCGWLLLATKGVQLILSFVLQWLGALGVLDLAHPSYGLSNTTYELLNMLFYVLFLPATAIAVVLITKNRTAPFPTGKVKGWLFLSLFLGGMGLAILSNVATSYVLQFLQGFGIEPPTFSQSADGSTTGLWLGILSTAVLPALAEEMVFRGYILGTLRPFGDKTALVISAVLFGLFHGNITQCIFATFVGLIFGLAVIKTDSIWPAVAIHFGNNLMSVLLDHFGTTSGIDVGILTSIVFAVVAAGGVVGLTALLIRDNGGTGKEELLRPTGNGGKTCLTARNRVHAVLTAPAMVAAWALLIYLLVVSL